ncbi:S8 family serine peptidase [Micromonospora pattaloongensis]|uniref:S8 family serine peptidase n=1 Tax=Micromonospora pattaloongensis TaxID=405436 RepID=UPI001FE05B38|nr:S8 family serine peptidase [Micromonospora pattaloongensis]
MTAIALLSGLLLAAGHPAGAAPSDPAPRPRPAKTTTPVTVTLLTGDRVTVSGADAGRAAVRPGPGRDGLRFVVERERGELYVVPQDAQPLLRGGTLDRRLFNVTALVRSGYHDAARDSLPLIVTYRPAAARSGAAALGAAGARIGRELPAINGAAVAADKATAARLWSAVTAGGARSATAAGIDRIWLDGKRRLSLDVSVPQIGAPAAHRAGFTGRGVTVAVLDSGVDAGHPDLADKVAESRNFSEAPEAGDTVGHGTHVASTIAGSGAASGGKYRGVAPDATLLSGKVCESAFCTDSAILAGMQWAAAEKRADVVNLSLGGADSPEIDPLEEAVNTLTAQTGTLFVIAAGNDGAEESIGSPGSADAALTVGAVDKSDELADFSSRGPRVGDDAVKPDITAPGVDIVAAKAAGTQLGEPVGEAYVAASGTSMATPHVAGAVALLAQQHPQWAATELKATLMASAKPHPELGAYAQGAGRVDVARAITQPVTADPVSLSYGRAIWPHADDAPITRTVTYRNSGPDELTLTLAARVTGPRGATPPAGMFRPSVERVTVPAGGQAQVSVTVDTRLGGPDGLYSGQLVATAGQTTVSTPIAVHQEVESYNLTLNHVDRSGAPTPDYFSLLIGLDGDRVARPYSEEGTATVRLPAGRYGLSSYLFAERAPDQYDMTLLVQPELTVTRDTAVTLDARAGRPVRMSVPDRRVAPVLVDVSAVFVTASGNHGIGMTATDFEGVTAAQLGRAGSPERFLSSVASQWAEPGPQGRFDDSRRLYALAEVFPGRMVNGFERNYRRADLATVRHEFRGEAPGGAAERAVFAVYPLDGGSLAPVLPTAVPGGRVEHYNTARGVRWDSELDFGTPAEDGWLDLKAILFSPQPVAYRAGRDYREQWNVAPFGPAMPASRFPDEWVSRQGDLLYASVPLFSDRYGHIGVSLTDTARTALYRDGKLLGETTDPGWGVFTVPPEPADYRLETRATRSVSDLATEVSAAWTFPSAHSDGDGFAKLPVMAVRFAPALDAANAAPSGRAFRIPVTVQRQPGAPAAQVRQLTVEVSYDDGRTWGAAELWPGRSGWTATVRHPAGAGYVSLRATAADSAGNTVTQSVIHAYRLR